MAVGRARIHHFVPKALQRYFLNDLGQIWYVERDELGCFCLPQTRNTKSTFKLRDYYTVLEDGRLTDRIETEFYSAMDNFLGSFLADIHCLLDKGVRPNVTGNALFNIRRVIYHLIVRTPEFASRYDDYEIGKDFLQDVLAGAKEKNFTEEEIASLRDELADKTKVKHQGRTIRVRSQTSPTDKVLDALEKFVVRFVQIE